MLEMRNSGEGLAVVDFDDAARAVRLSIVWIECQRRVSLGRGSVEILFPQVEDRRDVV